MQNHWQKAIQKDRVTETQRNRSNTAATKD